MSDALVIPMTLATINKSKARINTIDGQNNSHFVYCSLSGFWQHLEGQQLGQQQQQHKNMKENNKIINPRTNGPMNNPNPV
jgi:hypothetical protein